jgi:hypothetical protein
LVTDSVYPVTVPFEAYDGMRTWVGYVLVKTTWPGSLGSIVTVLVVTGSVEIGVQVAGSIVASRVVAPLEMDAQPPISPATKAVAVCDWFSTRTYSPGYPPLPGGVHAAFQTPEHTA